MAPLFKLVIRPCCAARGRGRPVPHDRHDMLEANPYLGRVVTGRIFSGAVKPNQAIKVLDPNGELIEEGRATKVLAFRGLEQSSESTRASPATSSPSPACRRRPSRTHSARRKSSRRCRHSRSTRRRSP